MPIFFYTNNNIDPTNHAFFFFFFQLNLKRAYSCVLIKGINEFITNNYLRSRIISVWQLDGRAMVALHVLHVASKMHAFELL